jgi:TRAP-type mannitol/chloroaromatic compound transport system permease small subunit
MILVGFYNVLARYLGRFIGIQLSSNLLIELQWYLFSLSFFFGFAFVLKRKLNVRVDFLYAHWTPKQKAWVDLMGHLLFLIPFCGLAIYVSFSPVLRSWGLLPDGSWGQWEGSPDPDGLPRAPIKSMILVAFLSLFLQALAEVIRCIAVIRDYPLLKQDP